MRKHTFFVKFLKKIYLLINNLKKKYLNKLNLNNFLNLARSNKFFLIFVALIILFLSYLSIPYAYDKDKVSYELKLQLENKLNLKFNLSKNLKYNFFPRPHFTYKDSSIIKNQNLISKIQELKIYFSLKNFFSLNDIKINDLIINNSNFNLNDQTYNFFLDLLNQNFKEGSFIIKDSNIFYRNENSEVLFINKLINMKYYYDFKDLKNIIISESEIFNLPYLLELKKNKVEKKIFSILNLNFLKFQIENEIDFKDDKKKGSMVLTLNHDKSNVAYKLTKDDFIFNFFDELDSSRFSYNGYVNLNPFYSRFKGETKEINLFTLFDSNNLILQLFKTEILNNKNLNFALNISAEKIKNHHNFINSFLNLNIQEGLIDIDNTQFNWKNDANFKISDTLIYVKEGELVLDGKLDLNIKNSNNLFKILLTPKKYRTKIKKINLHFIYNFDQKTLILNEIQIDNKFNTSINKVLKNLIFKKDKLQNKIYLKNKINSALKYYVG
jgi:hypothetical protein